jgi:hypothetical protein
VPWLRSHCPRMRIKVHLNQSEESDESVPLKKGPREIGPPRFNGPAVTRSPRFRCSFDWLLLLVLLLLVLLLLVLLLLATEDGKVCAFMAPFPSRV